MATKQAPPNEEPRLERCNVDTFPCYAVRRCLASLGVQYPLSLSILRLMELAPFRSPVLARLHLRVCTASLHRFVVLSLTHGDVRRKIFSLSGRCRVWGPWDH